MNLSGKRVLVFGDSLSRVGPDSGPEAAEISAAGSYSTPGAVMAQWLLGAGASAARIDARVGRSAVNFFGREDAGRLLLADAAWQPDIVLVMLGTNDLGMGQAADQAAFVKLRSALGGNGAAVYAIGPPSFPGQANEARRPAVLATLRSVFGSDRVLDAGPLTPTGDGVRARDGVHFSAAGGRKFGAALAAAVLQLGAPAPGPIASISPMVLRAGVGVFMGLLGLAWIIGRRHRLRLT